MIGAATEKWRRAAASKIGLTLARYEEMRAARRKFCWRCSNWLPESCYGRCKARCDGLSAICKQCRRDYDRVRRILKEQR